MMRTLKWQLKGAFCYQFAAKRPWKCFYNPLNFILCQAVFQNSIFLKSLYNLHRNLLQSRTFNIFHVWGYNFPEIKTHFMKIHFPIVWQSKQQQKKGGIQGNIKMNNSGQFILGRIPLHLNTLGTFFGCGKFEETFFFFVYSFSVWLVIIDFTCIDFVWNYWLDQVLYG